MIIPNYLKCSTMFIDSPGIINGKVHSQFFAHINNNLAWANQSDAFNDVFDSSLFFGLGMSINKCLVSASFIWTRTSGQTKG